MNVDTFAKNLLFSTVRIESSTQEGRMTGTAFIFMYRHEEVQFFFLVTNKHVINGASSGRFFFTLSDGEKPLIGKRFDIEMDQFEQRWFGNPNPYIDVAVMPLVPLLHEIEKRNKKVFFKAISDEYIPTAEQIDDLDAIEDILFVGYPNGIYDSKNLMPVIRRGITATYLKIDYEGKPQFLIDASVFPGSSGSPVLIVNSGGYYHRGGLVIGNRILFLGIISSVAIREIEGRVEFITSPVNKIPVVKSQQMLDLGVVFKASTILETITLFLKKEDVIS